MSSSRSLQWFEESTRILLSQFCMTFSILHLSTSSSMDATKMPSLDDLSDVSPPISDWMGRYFITFTAIAFIYVTAYTQRTLSLRILITAMMAFNVYLLLTMPNILGHMPGFDQLIANFIFAGFLRVIDLYFLRDESKVLEKEPDSRAKANGTANGRADNPSKGEVKSKALPNFIPMSAFQAFDYLVVNYRNIGTPYQVRNIPKFSKSSPSYIPSRRTFLLRKFVTIFIVYLALDLLTYQPAPPRYLYSQEQDFFLSRLTGVTGEEILFRILTNFNFWASTNCLIQYIYAIISLICVGSGIYEPKDFPPLVGGLGDSYSVRNHWRYVLSSPIHNPFQN